MRPWTSSASRWSVQRGFRLRVPGLAPHDRRGTARRARSAADPGDRPACRFDYFRSIGHQYVLLPEPDRPRSGRAGASAPLGNGPSRSRRVPTRRSSASSPATTIYLGDAGPGARRRRRCPRRRGPLRRVVHQPDLLRLRAEITAAPTRSGWRGRRRPGRRARSAGPGLLRPRAAGGQRPRPAPVRRRPGSIGTRHCRSVLVQFPDGSASPSSLTPATYSRRDVPVLGGGDRSPCSAAAWAP